MCRKKEMPLWLSGNRITRKKKPSLRIVYRCHCFENEERKLIEVFNIKSDESLQCESAQ
jgi:hypothetical protein